MPHLSRFRIFLGWVKELWYWFLIPIFFLPGLLIRYGSRAGKGDTTMILVADLFCQPLYYFRLRRALLKSGFSVIVIKTGSAFTSLHDQARNLSRVLEKHDVEKGVLLGHGMGSLVALALPDAGRQRIEHLVSVGTPFHGSRLFLYGRFIPAIRDMAVGSNFLLFNRMNALLFPSFTPFIAWQDELIIPFNLAQFGQGRDLIFDQVGHYNLVMSPENVQTLSEHLQEFYMPGSVIREQAATGAQPAPAAGTPQSQKSPSKQTPARAPAGKTAKKAPSRPAPKKAPAKPARKKAAKSAKKAKSKTKRGR